MNHSRRIGIFLIAISTHLGSLGYWFVAVDAPKLILSSRIRSWNDLYEIFTQPLMHETAFPELGLFYRPLASLTYSFDYWVWGVDPFGYHLTNLLLQGIAVVLVALVVGDLTDDRVVGELTAVLFALHPLAAEIVPATPRRHDILMLIFLLGSLSLFVKSQRRETTRRSSFLYVGGALVSYVLALGSKEPALVVPALVFVWTALQGVDSDPYDTLWRSVRATVPFGVVTVAYIAVRVTVLGGIGGYHGIDGKLSDVSSVVVAYLVSIAYPIDVFGSDLAVGWLWTGVVLLMGCLLAFVLIGVVASVIDGHVGANWFPLVVPFVGGCVLIGMSLGLAELDPLVALLPEFTPTPYSRLHTITGLLLVVTCLLGGLWIIGAHPATRDRIDLRTVSFFIAWFAVPLVVYAQDGRYLLRTGYASIVPAMAILAVISISALRALRTSDRMLDENAVLVGIVLLLLVPQISASPLFHSYDGWETTGDVNRMVLDGLAADVGDRNGTTSLHIHGLPNGIAEQDESFPQVKSIVYPGAQATRAWLKLVHPGRELIVHSEHPVRLDSVPKAVSITTTSNSETVIVRIHYEHDSERGALSSIERRANARSRSDGI
ncbi:phospholipid carrier-dependent glycosyltransferase [Halocatena salina]|uniref:Phospholipid carrier-dependent glycosyltransferase n=1 Tax=Halocatena salina TaxID=2934340 RepID=A0A8U0A046_9EURY|nr:phospholipid carrier-dependent glycosyltransferase [Halocatena salina]UPM42424.1 phospholipid carrier-dependent glycosyltransferase [Halocatena salina]